MIGPFPTKTTAKALVYYLFLALTLLPAISVVMNGRDVNNLDFVAAPDLASLASLVSRIGTASILACALTLTVFGTLRPRLGSRQRSKPTASRPNAAASSRQKVRNQPARSTTSKLSTGPSSQWLLSAVLLFFFTGTLLPSLFGEVPALAISHYYAILPIGAMFTIRRWPLRWALDATKLALAVLLVASALSAFYAPHWSISHIEEGSRLPFLSIRFWGLGSSPNSIAPLAMLTLILLIHRPFKLILLTSIVSIISIGTIITAQSQTTWAAALIVLPAYFLYTITPKPITTARIGPIPAILSIFIIGFGIVLLGWEIANIQFGPSYGSAPSPANPLSGNTDLITGRGRIWEAAQDMWRDNRWFGYGVSAWGLDHRTALQMPFAFSAHNQFFQAISVGGSISLAGLAVYVVALIRAAKSELSPFRGLTVGLIVSCLVRFASETPLESSVLLTGDYLHHLIILASIWAGTKRNGVAK